MLSKINRKMRMTSVALANETVRLMASRIFEREKGRTGSKMVAYDDAASEVGASASWLQKFLRGSPGVTLKLERCLNIAAAYDRLCEAIAADQRRLLKEHEDLRRQWNALAVALLGMGQGMVEDMEDEASGEADTARNDSPGGTHG